MAKFCAWCGKPTEEEDVFCAFCGKRADGSEMPAPTAAQVPQPPAAPAPQQQPQWQTPPAPPAPQQQPQWQNSPPSHVAQKRGGKGGLIIGIAAAVVVIAAVLVGGFVWPGFFKNGDKAETPEVPRQTEAPSSTKKPKETKAPKETEAPKPADTPTPTEAPYVNTFTDVKEDDWYYDAVCWAGKNGIVSGTEFQPGEPTNRGQALTFLWRAAGKPAPTLKVSPYTDVSADDWYFEPVLWAFENGVVSTASDGQFHADGTLTRAQAITFLCRAAGGSPQSRVRSFADVRIEDWFYDTAAWALENGIVGRDTTWTFQPNQTITRAQFVTFMSRAFDPDAKKADTAEPPQEGLRDVGVNIDVDDHQSPQTFLSVTKNGSPATFTANVTDYRVFEEDDAWPKRDGYEWRVMSIQASTQDLDGSGLRLTLFITDNYNVRLHYASKLSDDSGVLTYTVRCDGRLQDYTIWYSKLSDDKKGTSAWTFTASVPVGYDGVVVGFMSAGVNGHGSLADFYTGEQDFALFRMK